MQFIYIISLQDEKTLYSLTVGSDSNRYDSLSRRNGKEISSERPLTRLYLQLTKEIGKVTIGQFDLEGSLQKGNEDQQGCIVR